MAASSIATVLKPGWPVPGRQCRSSKLPSGYILQRRAGLAFHNAAAGRCPSRRNAGLHRIRVFCTLQQERDDERGKEENQRNQRKLVEPVLISATNLFRIITAIAALQVAYEAYLGIEMVPKMVPPATKKKRTRTMTAEERQKWTQGLPLVEEQVPYVDVIGLKQEGRLKHIIRHPEAKLKERAYEVLVVMDDDRVVRTLLPSASEAEFWEAWNKMKLDKVVTEAYTPPPPPPELPAWALKGPSLSFLKKIELAFRAKGKKQKPKPSAYRVIQSAAAARLQEMERDRQAKEAEKARIEAIRTQRKLAEELLKKRQDSKARRAQIREQRQSWNVFWENAANNEGVRFCLGVFFFWLFYVTIVVGVKKRRADYEDRVKLQKVEEEERKQLNKMEKELERMRKRAGGEMSEENEQLKMGLRFMRSGAKLRQGRANRSLDDADDEADVKFSDVAGLGKIRVELEEIVDFFTHAERFRRRGSKIPTGILLCGPPGVGKTLLAKAVAGEAGVNFFAISASQFVEIYVGVGASRVRSLYSEARDNSPAVVFIDELDAVGRKRGLSEGSGAQERDATLNQLLTCLDGFEGKGQVITIAATNRPDILDPALVRPGRFDRKIYIPKPSFVGRIEILKVHAKSKPMAEDVDYIPVAQMTDGMVGAQLAHIVDVAALEALRDGRTEVTTDDLLQAAHSEMGGQADDIHRRSERISRILALREASLAAMAANCPDFKNIQRISITPLVGESKGFTRFKTDALKFGAIGLLSRQGALDHITILLAPRAADELWNGPENLCTVWCDAVDTARRLARNYVSAGHTDNYTVLCGHSLDRRKMIDLEAQKIINSCYQRALEYLNRNREFVNALVEHLLKRRTIGSKEFQGMVNQFAVLDNPRPDPVEISNLKLEAFEQQVATCIERVLATSEAEQNGP